MDACGCFYPSPYPWPSSGDANPPQHKVSQRRNTSQRQHPRQIQLRQPREHNDSEERSRLHSVSVEEWRGSLNPNCSTVKNTIARIEKAAGAHDNRFVRCSPITSPMAIRLTRRGHPPLEGHSVGGISNEGRRGHCQKGATRLHRHSSRINAETHSRAGNCQKIFCSAGILFTLSLEGPALGFVVAATHSIPVSGLPTQIQLVEEALRLHLVFLLVGAQH